MRTNDTTSEVYAKRNGHWQACPLFLLIFLLNLEPFSQMVRAIQDIKGIQTKGMLHKLAAYVDDLILFCYFPTAIAFGRPLEIWCPFEVNYSKSEAMGVSIDAMVKNHIGSPFNFKWMDSYIHYLGTNIPKNLCTFF